MKQSSSRCDAINSSTIPVISGVRFLYCGCSMKNNSSSALFKFSIIGTSEDKSSLRFVMRGEKSSMLLSLEAQRRYLFYIFQNSRKVRRHIAIIDDHRKALTDVLVKLTR